MNKRECGQGVAELFLIFVVLPFVMLIAYAIACQAVPKLGESVDSVVYTIKAALADRPEVVFSQVALDEQALEREEKVAEEALETEGSFSAKPFSEHCYQKHQGQVYNCTTIAAAFDDGLCTPSWKPCPLHNKDIFYCKTPDGNIIGLVIGSTNDVVITGFAEDIPGYWENLSCQP
jgi:hypothetical protein